MVASADDERVSRASPQTPWTRDAGQDPGEPRVPHGEMEEGCRTAPAAPEPGHSGLEEASKLLSYILRHRPEEAGIALTRDGWAPVAALLEGLARRGDPLTFERLSEIVRTDAKGRYSLSPDRAMIRANQGHSRRLGVDPGLAEAVPPARLWHGTKERFLPAIRRQGLLPMSRSHVHLSADPDTAAAVGDRRGGRTVVLGVDAAEMLRDGHTFRVSENGVWLVERVPPAYLASPD